MRARERAKFDPTELAIALSHYDLGVIESITDFPRGSSRSPKVGIVCGKGKFLLKRRSIQRAHPESIRFAHRVQEHLAKHGFPAPAIVRTREHRNELLHIREHVYELFEFIAGQPFRQSANESRDAGAVLGRFHNGTENIRPAASTPTPRGDYHDAAAVRTGLCSIGSTLSSHDSFTGDEAELATLVQFLLGAYDEAATALTATGFRNRPTRIIHSDWHPGNLLFRNQKVVAVIDYDTLRVSQRMIDVANGALQFSITGSGDPATWPEQVDEDRFAAFLAGYESVSALSTEDRASIVDLITEALIAESVPPITETGSVGRWAGFRILQMIRRKVMWIRNNAKCLISVSTPEPSAGED